MSESTGAPAAPAAPAATLDSGGAPPPSSQPAISVSEAARLLSQQRRQGAEGEARPPAAGERKPSPNDAIAASAKAPEARTEGPQAPAAPTTPDGSLSPLERALGVTGETPSPESPAQPAAGGTVEIEGRHYTQAQLREAVLKSADYTTKTQEIAEQRRAIQQQQEALATVLPYIQPELAKLAQIVQSESAKPDISLMDSDPGRYFRELHAYEQLREEQGRLANLNSLQSQAQERALAQQVAQANEQLAAEFPFWKNEADRTRVQHDIVEWATTQGGFQREELRNLADPRALKTMMKSMLFDKWVAGTRTQAPASMAPVRGARPAAPPAAAVARASEAFDAAPNIRNAAALLGARRGNGSMPR